MKRLLNLKFSKLSKQLSYFTAFYILSFLIIIAFKGLNLGMDFNGGVLLEIRSPQIDEVKESLFTHIGQFSIQKTEADAYIIRAPFSDVDTTNLNHSLREQGAEIIKSEIVGASVGQDLKDKGVVVSILSLILMMAYLSFRFQYKFALGAILALMHDIIVVLGILSLTSYEFSINALVALLAIIGYSVNDTIIIFDRIRENLLKIPASTIHLSSIIDRSISQTLVRSIVTSFSTLLVVIALMMFGGDSLAPLSYVLFIGIIVGSYSSIFIAPLILELTKLTKKDLKPEEEEE